MNVQPNITRLKKLSDLLESNKESIAKANTLDSLIPYKTNLLEIQRAIANLRHYHSNASLLIQRSQKGGIAVVVPYNAPSFALFGMSLAAALLVNGDNHPVNVFFPSLLANYASQIRTIFKNEDEFRFVNFFEGSSKEFMDQSIANSEISVIQVYGGTWINAYIQQAKENKKTLIYEGSGNNPAIIHASADIEEAADKVLQMAFDLSGQAAVCFNRLLIDNRIDKDDFNSLLKDKCANISYSCNPFDDVVVGPIRIPQLVFSLEERIIDAIKDGAKPFNYKVKACTKGWLIQPTLIFNTNHSMRIVQEENFAPVLSVEYAKESELAKLANATKFGFTASVFGKSSQLIPILNQLKGTHGIVLKNHTFNDLVSQDYGYIGIWGGYKNSFFHLSEESNWEIEQQPKHLVTYFSQTEL